MSKITQANVQSIVAQELACCILLKVTQKEFNTIAETSNLEYCAFQQSWVTPDTREFRGYYNRARQIGMLWSR